MNTREAETDQVRSKRVDLIIRQLDSLPTLPVVAAKLLKATTTDNIALKEIIGYIESDQSLTAKVLALARRAHLGLGNTVSTVEKAVVLMGLDAIRNAVLSIKVFETFGPTEGREQSDSPFNRVEFWKHSLAVACTAQLIAEKLPVPSIDPDEVFVCGLLHDLGKVMLDTSLPKSFARVVKIAETNRISIAEVERRIFGLDHSTIGKKLGERWHLADSIVHTLWLHHHKSSALPEHIKYRELIDVIYLADLIAREQRIGYSGNFTFLDRSEPLARQLGISGDDYNDLLLELRARMGERASLIGLDQVSAEDLYRHGLQVANVELGRLNQSLSVVNRTLTSRARYFDAINEMHRQLKPGMAIGDMLEHVAGAIRRGLDLPGIVLCLEDSESGYLEAAFADREGTSTHLFEVAPRPPVLPDPADQSLLVDPPPFLEPVIAHYARQLGQAEVKLIRLVGASQQIGAVIFTCDGMIINRLVRERQEVEALAIASSLALGQSLVLEMKDRLADDLLAANRQMQELEQKLLEFKCFSALGELAAGAAHELNNPLAIISGRGQLLRDQEDDAEKRKSLDVIIEQSHNASELVTEMMALAKPLKPQPQTVMVKELFEGIAENAAQTHELNPTQITVDIGEGAGSAYCDLQQLTDAVKELLTNAIDAAEKDNVQITLSTVAEDDPQYVQIRVVDNGLGMAPNVLHKALDIFFSARKAGRKRGFGLPRVYQYAQANHGMFWIESEPGLGTTAYLRLPTRPASDINRKDARGS